MADQSASGSKPSSVASRIAAFEARARAVQDDGDSVAAPALPSAAAAAAAAAASIAVRKASRPAPEGPASEAKAAEETVAESEIAQMAAEAGNAAGKVAAPAEEAPAPAKEAPVPAEEAPAPAEATPAPVDEATGPAEPSEVPSSAHAALADRWSSIEARLASLEMGASARCRGAAASASPSAPAFVPVGIPPAPASDPPVAYVDPSSSATSARLSSELESLGVRPYAFVRAPADYYDRPLEFRRSVLGAASIDQLCKTIVLTNTKRKDNEALAAMRAEDPFVNAQHYAVIVQYNARLNAEKLRAEVHARCEGKAPKKNFNMRLAPEAESIELTGFVHNAVTPVGSKTRIPIVLSNKVAELAEGFFWIGGGEPDLKLGVDTKTFIKAYKPWVLDCTDAPDAK